MLMLLVFEWRTAGWKSCVRDLSGKYLSILNISITGRLALM